MENKYTTEGVAEYLLTLFPATFTGVCVDIGAFDPFWISNSWLLERMGWDTYCVEPNPHCIPRLKQYRKNVIQCACGKENKDNVDLFTFSVPVLGDNAEAAGTGLVDHRKNKDSGVWHSTIYSTTSKVRVRTLDWLMENEIKQGKINVLSIDVERSEMDVLLGTNLSKWKPDIIVIENLDNDTDQKVFMGSKSYKYVHRIIYNDFYVSPDYYKRIFE